MGMKVTRRSGLLLGASLGMSAATLSVAGSLRKRAAAAEDDEMQDLSEVKPTVPPMPMPEIAFAGADGATRHLSDFLGRAMVVNLWATWCHPCVAEMPALSRLSRALAPDDIAVMPLSSDRGGVNVVRRFFDEHGIDSLPILVDPHGDAAHALGVRGIPTTVIVDRRGHERARLEGATDWGSAAAAALVRRIVAG